MIVDDEKVSLMMTEHILSSEYETVSASDGNEALELYSLHKPDLILSDLHMPQMSGYQLQQKINEIAGYQVPFMFMTADKADETESQGFENGALDFIRKPFRADVLLKRVGNILQTVEKIHGLTKAASTDPMTGLLNKARAQETISELCKTSQGVLMIIDLDSFKLVNDIYGHDMGDKILIRFAEILQAVVRASDIVGRIGGDEFIAFCKNVSDEIVIDKKVRFINKILLESAQEFMGPDMNIPLGASLGCVPVPVYGTDFEKLCKMADKALLNVQQNGKHGYLFYSEVEDGAANLMEASTNGIQGAVKILEERNIKPGAFLLSFEQFRLIYQYTVRLASHNEADAHLLYFVIKPKEGAKLAEDVAEEIFLSVLQSSLRQSDAVCQSSRSQFYALLSDAELYKKENRKSIYERIEENWQAEEISKEYEMTMESFCVK
jgi:diguanylate cyclase (GGDEF)-like protein